MRRCNKQPKESRTLEEGQGLKGHGHSHAVPAVTDGGFEVGWSAWRHPHWSRLLSGASWWSWPSLSTLSLKASPWVSQTIRGMMTSTWLCVDVISRSVWLLFIAISAHKYVISFCISMQFVTSGLSAVLRSVQAHSVNPTGVRPGHLNSRHNMRDAEICTDMGVTPLLSTTHSWFNTT